MTTNTIGTCYLLGQIRKEKGLHCINHFQLEVDQYKHIDNEITLLLDTYDSDFIEQFALFYVVDAKTKVALRIVHIISRKGRFEGYTWGINTPPYIPPSGVKTINEPNDFPRPYYYALELSLSEEMLYRSYQHINRSKYEELKANFYKEVPVVADQEYVCFDIWGQDGLTLEEEFITTFSINIEDIDHLKDTYTRLIYQYIRNRKDTANEESIYNHIICTKAPLNEIYYRGCLVPKQVLCDSIFCDEDLEDIIDKNSYDYEDYYESIKDDLVFVIYACKEDIK